MCSPRSASTSTCFGRLAMTSASGVDPGRPAAFASRSSTSTLARHELGRPPVQLGEIVEIVDPVRLVQTPPARPDARNEAQVRHLFEPVTAPFPPSAHVALVAHDRFGQQHGAAVVQVVLGRLQDPEPVGELELVAGQGAHGPGRSTLDILGRRQVGLGQVVPDDHPLGAAHAGGEAFRRGDAGRVEQGAVVRQLQQVAHVPARALCSTSMTAASRKGVVTSETGACRSPPCAHGRAPCATSPQWADSPRRVAPGGRVGRLGAPRGRPEADRPR